MQLLSERDIAENIPADILEKFRLVKRFDAYKNIHFPASSLDYQNAVKRIKFEELFISQLRVGLYLIALFVTKSLYAQIELRETVRHERMVELAFEGQRFFDIRRWGIAEEVFNVPIKGLTYVNNGQLTTVDQPGVVRNFQQRDYLWPIPQKEMDLNKSLQQNTGW